MKLLQEISRSIPTIDNVCHIADELLKNIEPIGGRAWVMAKQANGGVLNPQQTVRDVLQHWCNMSPDAPYGGCLYDVLKVVAPRVAEEFERELLSSE